MPLGRLPQNRSRALPQNALPRGPVILMMALGAWIALVGAATALHSAWAWIEPFF
ncbi:MAG: hypothetical protein ABL879_08370 [Devosia sp.]